MIDNGKDKLEWYRTVDAAKLDHLKEMMLQVRQMLEMLMMMLDIDAGSENYISGQLQGEPGHSHPHHL